MKRFMERYFLINIFKILIRTESNILDQYIIPGFVDLHCHGAINYDTMQGVGINKKNGRFSSI